ncbi:hypothetical protein CCR75_000463 [Bremia lactucae]|uniref:Uncharacterized protein n=1 Tax=Bremia lactucae TaxID=4779 RepID=A0A976FL66_BRELC|nr:hypothetical protein CCR75_000463 [Bremia lactucae]
MLENGLIKTSHFPQPTKHTLGGLQRLGGTPWLESRYTRVISDSLRYEPMGDQYRTVAPLYGAR